jgi:hypothetical protein
MPQSSTRRREAAVWRGQAANVCGLHAPASSEPLLHFFVTFVAFVASVLSTRRKWGRS